MLWLASILAKPLMSFLTLNYLQDYILMVFVVRYYNGWKIFFTGRTHQTKIETALSDLAVLLSGVVQGSGIGPLMFLVYIYELIYILEQFNINVKLFADDVKMYMKIINDTTRL